MKRFRFRALSAAWLPIVATAAFVAVAPGSAVAGAAATDPGKLRIICFGAHPDDCELQAAGVAALWAAKGHKVKFVSVTNGDIGHWRDAGGPLALRRKAEVEAADRISKDPLLSRNWISGKARA